MGTPPWYKEPDQYTDDTPFDALGSAAGPHGPAVVRVFGEKTQPGWGRDRFMQNYTRGFFSPSNIPEDKPYAIVMRSLRLLCVDIDGKNDGYETASKLDLPITLAETSKSGNGHHLYYSYPDEWDVLDGYAAQPDRVGMWPGIDIKSVGVVYHHLHQQWNTDYIVELPDSTWQQLLKRNERDAYLRVTSSQAAEMADEDLKFKRDMLLIELSKPRKDGRDSSLWRIGASA